MANNTEFFNTLNKEYRKGQGFSPAKRQKLTGIGKLQKMEEYKDKQAALTVFIDYADYETGDLYHYDNANIAYAILADDIKKLFPSYTSWGSSYLLGCNFTVTVRSVDMDTSTVFLTPVVCSLNNDDFLKMSKKGEDLSSYAERLEQLLHTGLKTPNMRPEIRGTVTKVEKDRIFLDLFDTGVIGVVPVKNYMEQYRRDLRDIVYPGDSLKGIVIDYRTRPGENDYHFIISTANYIPNPWFKAKKFHTGDIVIVKAVEKFKDFESSRTFFWGVSRILPNIDILCDYTTKIPYSAVKEGSYYKCKITKVNPYTHHLKVSPFAECVNYDFGLEIK